MNEQPGILCLRFRRVGGGLPDGAGYAGLLALLGSFTPSSRRPRPTGRSPMYGARCATSGGT